MPLSYRIYPHNELLSLARYQLDIINGKSEKGINVAIALDCVAILISLAFSVEAILNFVGHKCIKGWEERQPYYKKLREVCNVADIPIDAESELFSTLDQLKLMRDMIAHGKPIENKSNKSFSEEVGNSLKSPWAEYSNPEFANIAYRQVNEFKKIVFSRYNIKPGTALTSAAGWG